MKQLHWKTFKQGNTSELSDEISQVSFQGRFVLNVMYSKRICCSCGGKETCGCTGQVPVTWPEHAVCSVNPPWMDETAAGRPDCNLWRGARGIHREEESGLFFLERRRTADCGKKTHRRVLERERENRTDSSLKEQFTLTSNISPFTCRAVYPSK